MNNSCVICGIPTLSWGYCKKCAAAVELRYNLGAQNTWPTTVEVIEGKGAWEKVEITPGRVMSLDDWIKEEMERHTYETIQSLICVDEPIKPVPTLWQRFKLWIRGFI